MLWEHDRPFGTDLEGLRILNEQVNLGITTVPILVPLPHGPFALGDGVFTWPRAGVEIEPSPSVPMMGWT